MQKDIHKILMKYWGYPSFRPMQEEIIESVLAGRDTLGLLPTGGGKSLTFQVPTMVREGMCLVITPLIALMKDQVEQLKSKDISAVAIYSGMSKREISLAMDNAMYGNIKFLYISPERLESDLIRENVSRMNINLLAIDEAHCISQWGYDFRPAYLHIANIRERIPDVSVLALTATATPEVVEDIQKQLLFKSKNVFRKSFLRKNLIYVVQEEEDKRGRLLRIIRKMKGSGIVYVRNRRKTKEISLFLNQNHIESDYYHAGLELKVRERKQNRWMQSHKSVMVSTNAFGMGIDKPDVRFVVHVDLPDSPEAYFQEAGRGGRDGKLSYAVLLYDQQDVDELKRQFALAYPEIDFIKNVYYAIGNYLNIAIGAGKDVVCEFDIRQFSERYNFNMQSVYYAMKFLEKDNYLFYQEYADSYSRVHIKMSKSNLYKFQVENPNLDRILSLLLRSYQNILQEFQAVDETKLARRLSSKDKVFQQLMMLKKMDVIDYHPQRSLPQITFTTERLRKEDVYISYENYHARKKEANKRMKLMLAYVADKVHCRSQFLLRYFGEKDSLRCGKCDNCLARNRVDLSQYEFDQVLAAIKPYIKENHCTVDELYDKQSFSKEKMIKVLRWLLDNDKVKMDEKNRLYWR